MKRLLCKLPKWMGGGHKRGKRDNGARPVNVGEQAYRCPRCKETWARKAKPAKVAA